MEPTHTSEQAVDLDWARRPGVPRERTPAPWPNTRYPPTPQHGKPAAPLHGRKGKSMPPVYGTAMPLNGLPGLIRKVAYRYPDHWLRHWLMLLFADRVDSWRTHAKRLGKVAVPAMAVLALAKALRAR